MNILIIEDEKPAAEQLMRLLRREVPKAFFHGPLQSIKEARHWLLMGRALMSFKGKLKFHPLSFSARPMTNMPSRPFS